MHDPNRFAELLLACLELAAVTPQPEFAEHSFQFTSPRGYTRLQPWYDRYVSAADDAARRAVVEEFVRYWRSQQAATERPLRPDHWLPLLRSHATFENSKLRLAGLAKCDVRLFDDLFAYQPLAEHLVLAVAEDMGDQYRYLTPADLQALGLTFEQALAKAWANLAQLRRGPTRFESMPGLAWVPQVPVDEHCATCLCDVQAVRQIPVRGRHIAFIPHTHVLWITGSEDHGALRMLVKLGEHEYAQPPGRPLTAVPLILSERGEWEPWQPPREHPLYWEIKRLHALQDQQLYEEQKDLLVAYLERYDNAPDVATCYAFDIAPDNSERVASYCIFTAAWNLLPKTDFIILRPVTNLAEMDADPNVDFQFGPSLCVPWPAFVEQMGAYLVPQGHYPERYYLDMFPGDEEWQALLPHGQPLPPGFASE